MLQLCAAILFSLAGLLTISALVDHCARDARFCAHPPLEFATLEMPPGLGPPEPEPKPDPEPARAVFAHAFDPLPLSFEQDTTRHFVLPPGQSMLDMATEPGRISVTEISLIAVVQQDGIRHALVRLPDGRILRLEQGDALEGGTVAVISADALYMIGPDHVPKALVLGG